MENRVLYVTKKPIPFDHGETEGEMWNAKMLASISLSHKVLTPFACEYVALVQCLDVGHPLLNVARLSISGKNINGYPIFPVQIIVDLVTNEQIK